MSSAKRKNLEAELGRRVRARREYSEDLEPLGSALRHLRKEARDESSDNLDSEADSDLVCVFFGDLEFLANDDRSQSRPNQRLLMALLPFHLVHWPKHRQP